MMMHGVAEWGTYQAHLNLKNESGKLFQTFTLNKIILMFVFS